MNQIAKTKEIIEKNAWMLLNLYGVKEKLIKDNPEALTAFINILNDELLSAVEEEIKKRKEKHQQILKDSASVKEIEPIRNMVEAIIEEEKNILKIISDAKK